MVTEFNTTALATSSQAGEAKGSNTVLIILGLAVAGFLVYKFVIKPAQDKKQQEQNATT